VPTHRERVLSCPRGGTFKYFLERDEVGPTWKRLEDAFGPAAVQPLGTIAIETRALIIRSTRLRNPLTVFRKRTCREEDVTELHALIGYRPGDEELT
jgi:hypothetical protein